MNLSATWPIRGSRAVVMIPKLEPGPPQGCPGPLVTHVPVLGEPRPLVATNCVWLNTLKNSALNSKCIRSLTRNSFRSATSQLLIPGPRKKRRLAFPSWPSCSDVKSEVLKYGAQVGLLTHLRGSEKFHGPGA